MIALDPNQTFEFFLDIEADVPEEQRTRFRGKFLSAREMVLIQEHRQRAMEAKADAAIVEALCDACKVGLKGVNGAMPADLAALVSIDVLWELPLQLIRQARLAEEDRKKSALLSVSAATPKSAGTVPGAGAR